MKFCILHASFSKYVGESPIFITFMSINYLFSIIHKYRDRFILGPLKDTVSLKF
jgi:hypothetical protein